MKKSILCLFIVSFLSHFSYSQKKIYCQVLDISTNEPIVYATVLLKRINRGTHADLNGKFAVPIKYKEKGIIKISSIGYTTKEIILSQLKENGLNVIYLSTSNTSLSEVNINSSKKRKRKLLGIQIVRKAIDNILENYPTKPHSYIGYYRDYQQPVGDSYQKIIDSKKPIKYINVHEAIIESFDDGFDSNKLESKQNQSLLYSYRVNNQFIQDSTLTIPYDNRSKKYSESVYITPLGGNELNLLNLTNAIRNHDRMSFSYSNIFNRDFVRNHKFWVKDVIYSNDVPIYKIYFSSIKKRTSYEYAAYGNIYISKQDFAIHKFNYNLYYRNRKNPQYSVTIEYTPKKDKMYLNYITFNNFFEATNGNYFKIDKTVFSSKLNAFKIYFNRQIDISSINPIQRNFKIFYKDKKLKLLSVTPFEGSRRIFIAHIDKESMATINFEKERDNQNYASYFRFDITNVRDFNGFRIDKRSSIKMNQYREFFVQETFEDKKPPTQSNFINKKLPLSKSLTTPLKLENNYWLNTPLKSSKSTKN